MIEYAGYALITAGSLLVFFAALSVARLPDFYSRLASFLKFAGFGVLCLTLGALFCLGFSAASVKALVCCALILITLPAEAHSLMRSAKRSGIKIPRENAENGDGKTE